jgi:hypothetical protein
LDKSEAMGKGVVEVAVVGTSGAMTATQIGVWMLMEVDVILMEIGVILMEMDEDGCYINGDECS